MYDKQIQNLFIEVAAIRKRLNVLAPELSKLEAPTVDLEPINKKIIDLNRRVSDNVLSEEDKEQFVQRATADMKRRIEDVERLSALEPDVFKGMQDSPLVGWYDGKPKPTEFEAFLPAMDEGDVLVKGRDGLIGAPRELPEDTSDYKYEEFDYRAVNEGNVDFVVDNEEGRYAWLQEIYYYYPSDFGVGAYIKVGENEQQLTQSMQMQRLVIDAPSPIKVEVKLDQTSGLTTGALEVWTQKRKFTK